MCSSISFESGMQSSPVINTISPAASFIPRFLAAAGPLLSCLKYLNLLFDPPIGDLTICSVPSVDPSSITITSNLSSGYV